MALSLRCLLCKHESLSSDSLQLFQKLCLVPPRSNPRPKEAEGLLASQSGESLIGLTDLVSKHKEERWRWIQCEEHLWRTRV